VGEKVATGVSGRGFRDGFAAPARDPGGGSRKRVARTFYLDDTLTPIRPCAKLTLYYSPTGSYYLRVATRQRDHGRRSTCKKIFTITA
jgi:hypothetical protein